MSRLKSTPCGDPRAGGSQRGVLEHRLLGASHPAGTPGHTAGLREADEDEKEGSSREFNSDNSAIMRLKIKLHRSKIVKLI